MSLWLRRLLTKTAALKEPRQRAAVFLAEMTRRSGEETVFVLRRIVELGWRHRSAEAKLLLDTAMDVIASGAWDGAHLEQVYRAAEAAGDGLVQAMLPLPGVFAASSAADALPVPVYASDRPLTLGERKSLAARPNRRLIALAVQDPHPQVIERLLANPKITENDVVAIAAKRPNTGAVLRTVSRHPKWRIRPRVVRALVYNPHTPPAAAVSLVHLLPPPDVAMLERDPKAPPEARRFATELNRLKP